jgi:hypothetical protein
VTFSLNHCIFARALLAWAVRDGRMRWGEHNQLQKAITVHERRMMQCLGKQSFATFEAANTIAKKPHRHAHSLKAYKCHNCHQYHVGTHSTKSRFERVTWQRRIRQESDV